MIDERFHRACEHFDKQEYFEAHEVWEDLWNEAHGARHAFLQCLIQVAVALHHGRNGNWNGAKKLCASALGYLEKGQSDSDPVAVDKLKDHVLDLALVIQKLAAGEPAEISYFKLPIK
jgi:predicted metal-dependent hydrolase